MSTRKLFTKIIGIVTAMAIMVLSFFSVPMKVSASWYGWTYATFQFGFYTQTYYFDGNNVGMSWGGTTHSSSPTHINDSNGFQIALQKKTGFGWSTFAEKTFPRSGAGTAKWEGVGSGEFRFMFKKGTDGVTEYVEKIEMYSW